MKRVVVDASVAIKWLVPIRQDENDVDKALALFGQIADVNIKMIQPPHFLAEVMGVVARLEPDFADNIFTAFSNMEFVVMDHPEIYRTAIKLSVELNHHLFDTLYHAVALNSQDTTLISADEAYYRKAKTIGRIMTLRDY